MANTEHENQDEGTDTPDEQENGSEEQPEGSTDDSGDDAETFPREYVEKLRQENADQRLKAKRSDELEQALRTAVIASATSKILVDPQDLPWTDELADENGFPNPEEIRKAASALVVERPHLGRIQGSAGQGFRGESSDSVDLAGLLRMSA